MKTNNRIRQSFFSDFQEAVLLTYHTLLLTAAKSKTFATYNGKFALRELPKVFFKFARLNSLVIEVLFKVGVSYDVVSNSLILNTLSLTHFLTGK